MGIPGCSITAGGTPRACSRSARPGTGRHQFERALVALDGVSLDKARLLKALDQRRQGGRVEAQQLRYLTEAKWRLAPECKHDEILRVE